MTSKIIQRKNLSWCVLPFIFKKSFRHLGLMWRTVMTYHYVVSRRGSRSGY
jgi:hypothetical protein